MRPDKQKVVDEVWDDSRVAEFLEKAPLYTGLNADFSRLLYAYRSMRPDDFCRFLALFVQHGGNLDARDEQGATLIDTIRSHRHAAPFIEALKDAGATA